MIERQKDLKARSRNNVSISRIKRNKQVIAEARKYQRTCRPLLLVILDLANPQGFFFSAVGDMSNNKAMAIDPVTLDPLSLNLGKASLSFLSDDEIRRVLGNDYSSGLSFKGLAKKLNHKMLVNQPANKRGNYDE